MEGLEDETGNITYARSNIINTATRFYEELYKEEEQTDDQIASDINIGEEEEETPEFLNSEVTKAIRDLKNEKSPGEDQILNEMLKIGIEELTLPIKVLFNKILMSETTPRQWKNSKIILIHKKGKRNDINNYRPISLQPALCKLFSKLLQARIKGTLNEFQEENQAGFRKNYSTTDNLYTINQLIEKSKEYNINLRLAFIDYTKAFDSLKHTSIWTALSKAGVNKKYIRIIRDIYNKNTAQIRLETEGPKFGIKRGVKQGDPLSPDLFNCVLETIFKNLDWDEKQLGFNINGKYLNNLRFADDIIVIAKNDAELKRMMKELEEASNKVGLKMNLSKTKVMTSSKESLIEINDNKIETVEEYIYLGQAISLKNGLDGEIQRRIQAGWAKFWSLKYIFKGKLSMKTKRTIFDLCISPVLTYGSQTWAMTKTQENKIKVCQNRMERSILGLRLSQKVTIQEIKRKTKIADIVKTMKTLKWSWAGHVARKNENSWCRRITDWTPRYNRRNRGRQHKRWSDDITKTAGSLWTRKAQNREEWSTLGEAYVQ